MTSRQPVWRTSSIGAAISCVRQGARESEQIGRVVGSFSAGFYLRFGRAIFAIGRRSIRPGPLHLTVEGGVPPLRAGASATMSADRLRTGPADIDLTTGLPWKPPEIAGDSRVLAGTWLTAAQSTEHLPAELHAVWPDVESAVSGADLDHARHILQGRGTGLTPAGDDVLAGLLLVDALFNPGCTRAPDIAAAACTTDLSKSFLYWAARGHSIEPVHRLLSYAAAGQPAEADRAASLVASIGNSSGRAILAGIGLAEAMYREGVDRREAPTTPAERPVCAIPDPLCSIA